MIEEISRSRSGLRSFVFTEHLRQLDMLRFNAHKHGEAIFHRVVVGLDLMGDEQGYPWYGGARTAGCCHGCVVTKGVKIFAYQSASYVAVRGYVAAIGNAGSSRLHWIDLLS